MSLWLWIGILLYCLSQGQCDPTQDQVNGPAGKLRHKKMLLPANFSSPAIPITVGEQTEKSPCTFHGAHCPTEKIEHQLVDKHFLPSDSVLELGARFGTTSCHIASKQENSGKLVAVEPDQSVWNLLAHNRNSHSCNFWIYHGVVSNVSVIVEPAFYATRAVPTAQAPGGKASIGAMQFDEIQEKTGVQFNALLIDCEGCIDTMFHNKAGDDSIEKMASYLANVEVIILEGDMPLNAPDCKANCVDYQEWIKRFESMGFTKVDEIVDDVYKFIIHYAFERVDVRNKKRAAMVSPIALETPAKQ